MNDKVRLKRNVYIIIAGVLLLTLGFQLSKSQYVLRFSTNDALPHFERVQTPVAGNAVSYSGTGGSYCIAFDSQDPYSVKTKDQVERTLQEMKRATKTSDVRNETFSASGCGMIVVATEQLELLGAASLLPDFAEQGGYVFIATHPAPNDTFYRIYHKMGIMAEQGTVVTKGIRLTSNVLIGENGLAIDHPLIDNTSLAVELHEKSRVLAKSPEGLPLLWDYTFGKGKFMVMNGTMLAQKINRGVIAGAISMLEPDFLYPIINAKLFYIDDFPAPLPRGVHDGIYRDFRRDIPTFFKEIWWPDMLSAASRYDIKFTAALIESYSDQVEPPFERPEDADLKTLLTYGRELIKSGGEIGMHGFNHQSLHTSPEVAGVYGYKPWSGVESMTQAVEEARRFAAEVFPNYKLLTYVPPSNVLSPEGREALKRGLPSVSVISSLFEDDLDGNAYSQEFEIAPDGIVELPRLTSGYTESPDVRWMIANGITMYGVFSHFIHPDDLLDERRGDNLSWENLYREFTGMVSRLDSAYPWLRPMTSTQAAAEVKNLVSGGLEIVRDAETIRGKIDSFHGPRHFILRSSRHVAAASGCKAQKLGDGAYLITAVKADFEIALGE
ncbi:DUF2194 domain-containing protein [Paenibacillus flagellatus]|uniref:DUF2194 domain-containing protein n=1 Tax=Paenibacillus flagellatus TaxID=2211139 RepID=A0A2V5K7A5_9BACL|nr:DUF2194 domain-containing protein [Paenibacillus flagellatus]PYI53834.1 DUF2194 domain-containing protein [Paenibacillus flagellatus]